VQTLDEGSTLTCSVIALNIAGKSDPARSHGVKVPVPHVKGCPKATGKLSGTGIASLRLGMTRKQAHAVYKKSSSRVFKYKTFFCLTPEGVRVGYGSPILLKSLPKKLRGKYSSRVVWASTSNPIYAIKGVRAGATLAAAPQASEGRQGNQDRPQRLVPGAGRHEHGGVEGQARAGAGDRHRHEGADQDPQGAAHPDELVRLTAAMP
jgi:hypothetical protein